MSNSRIAKAIDELQKMMSEEGIDPRKGLTEELFIFVTTLMPCPNVDLLIRDEENRVLLTWRSDKYYGEDWHIPGGCLRMKETLIDRVQKTVLKEIGTEVIINTASFITREGIIFCDRPWLENELERSHNISMLFECKLPDGFQINNKEDDKHTEGYLKWFDHYPDDLLQAHKDLDGDILKGIWKK